MSQSTIVGAIEIGTSKVIVLVGEIVDRKSLNLIGLGQSSSEGVVKGEIQNFRAAGHVTHAAIMSAEKSAGTRIDKVYLAQSGKHLEGFYHKGSVTVSTSDNTVSSADIARAVREAKTKQLPAERVYIHHIRNNFILDDRAVSDPLGMDGEKLEVGYWSIHGDKRKVTDHIRVINGYGLDVEDLIVSSIAGASMVLSEEEKQAGALVIDIGAGTTDWALYMGGCIVRTGVVAVGGEHLVNDLALGLRIDTFHARKILHEFGSTSLGRDEVGEKVWMVGDQTIGDRQLSRKAITQIIQARMEELFTVLSKQLGGYATPDRIAAGAVLTGGVVALPGLDILAGRVLGIQAGIGRLPRSWISDELDDPAYSTVLGLMHYALTGQHEDDASLNQRSASHTGFLGKMAKILGGTKV